jgi:peptidoglycan/xylan/chitin deacetylase (PgdA/CDA1 family)
MVPIGSNQPLVEHLRAHPGYHIAQHGYNHEFIRGDCEFEHHHRQDLALRLEQGSALLAEAGFAPPEAFVAPYDRFTRTSFEEVAKRFRVISTAWLELGRLPVSWWPQYVWNKAARRTHWEIGKTVLLTHPRCYLSFRRPYGTMLEEIKQSIASRYPDEAFIGILHQLADYLGEAEDIRVLSFQDVARKSVPLN